MTHEGWYAIKQRNQTSRVVRDASCICKEDEWMFLCIYLNRPLFNYEDTLSVTVIVIGNGVVEFWMKVIAFQFALTP